MMEYREVCRRDGSMTGEIVEKHAPKRAGDYFRHVLLFLKMENSPPPGQGEGLYLVQQRSLKARYFAGKWDVTGGGVQAGETPLHAAVREAKEELRLELQEAQLTLVKEYPVDWPDGTGLVISAYACRIKLPDNGLSWDETEVNSAGVYPFSQFRRWVMDHNDEAFGRMMDWIEAHI